MFRPTARDDFRVPGMRRAGFAALIAGLAIGGALTLRAESRAETATLFSAGEGGYAFYRIPGIVVSSRGTVLAYCEARREGRSDWESIDLLLRRSSDGGKTWDAPRKLADVPGPKAKNPVALALHGTVASDVTYSNPVAIATRDGTVHVLFCLEFSRCFYLRSDDDGATFSAPIEITGAFEAFRPECDWKVITVGPTHGIELKTGRLVAPVGLSTGTAPGGFLPSVVATIVSDDRGKTWQRGDLAVPNTAEWINPNVPVAAELSDGRVMLNVRTSSQSQRRLVTTSPDGATRWSTPRFDPALREPICEASLLSTTLDGRRALVFANPDNLARAGGQETPGTSRDRRNLSIKVSYDDGATWPVNRVLDPGPSGYSDLAALPDGTILCLYEQGAVEGNLHKPSRLAVARLSPAWFTAHAATGFSPAPLAGRINVNGLAIDLTSPPRGTVVHESLGHALPQIGINEFAPSQTRPPSAIRVGDWALRHCYEGDHDELYPLPADLSPQRDRAAGEPARARSWRQRLDQMLRSAGVRFATPTIKSLPVFP